MAVVVAIRRHLPPSRLLMPLVFAAAPALLLLTGSPVNVVIFADSRRRGRRGHFGFAEFALAGIPLVPALVLPSCSAHRFLPDRARRDAARTSASTPRRWCRTTRSTTSSTSGWAASPPSSVGRADSWDLRLPGTQRHHRLDGESAADRCPTACWRGDRLPSRATRATSSSSPRDSSWVSRPSTIGRRAARRPGEQEPGGAEVVVRPGPGWWADRSPRAGARRRDSVVLAVQRQGQDRGATEDHAAGGRHPAAGRSWSRSTSGPATATARGRLPRPGPPASGSAGAPLHASPSSCWR